MRIVIAVNMKLMQLFSTKFINCEKFIKRNKLIKFFYIIVCLLNAAFNEQNWKILVTNLTLYASFSQKELINDKGRFYIDVIT